MENTMYNIILANGTEIHATLNGNNYITDDEVNIEILSDANLSSVNIGGVDYKDMTCTSGKFVTPIQRLLYGLE